MGKWATLGNLSGWRFLHHREAGWYYGVNSTGLIVDATEFVESKGESPVQNLSVYGDMLYQSYKLAGELETVEVG